jgi:hypothetical protein
MNFCKKIFCLTTCLCAASTLLSADKEEKKFAIPGGQTIADRVAALNHWGLKGHSKPKRSSVCPGSVVVPQPPAPQAVPSKSPEDLEFDAFVLKITEYLQGGDNVRLTDRTKNTITYFGDLGPGNSVGATFVTRENGDNEWTASRVNNQEPSVKILSKEHANIVGSFLKSVYDAANGKR